MDFHLPFEVGQSAEAQSFQLGYRSAWFRCKIKEINRKRGHWNALLEYFDFPDERLTWMRLYQHAPYRDGKSKRVTPHLMLRPSYPPICHEKEIFDESTLTEVKVMIEGTWQVGDSVDWWANDCYWAGKLTKILDNAKAEVELIPPPVGEGRFYEVNVKDLRPSLEWSPELGWTLPTSLVSSRVQLIQPMDDRDLGGNPEAHRMHESEKEVRSTSGSNTQMFEDSGFKESCSDAATEVDGQPSEDLYYAKCPLDKFRASGGIALNSTGSDTLEAAVVDLEETRNKIKWLKRILESGNPQSKAHDSWEFAEHGASSQK